MDVSSVKAVNCINDLNASMWMKNLALNLEGRPRLASPEIPLLEFIEICNGSKLPLAFSGSRSVYRSRCPYPQPAFMKSSLYRPFFSLSYS
jgi:hypothetical protein